MVFIVLCCSVHTFLNFIIFSFYVFFRYFFFHSCINANKVNEIFLMPVHRSRFKLFLKFSKHRNQITESAREKILFKIVFLFRFFPCFNGYSLNIMKTVSYEKTAKREQKRFWFRFVFFHLIFLRFVYSLRLLRWKFQLYSIWLWLVFFQFQFLAWAATVALSKLQRTLHHNIR